MNDDCIAIPRIVAAHPRAAQVYLSLALLDTAQGSREPLTQQAIAETAGMGRGHIKEHLTWLVEGGWIERITRGKRHLYRLPAENKMFQWEQNMFRPEQNMSQPEQNMFRPEHLPPDDQRTRVPYVQEYPSGIRTSLPPTGGERSGERGEETASGSPHRQTAITLLNDWPGDKRGAALDADLKALIEMLKAGITEAEIRSDWFAFFAATPEALTFWPRPANLVRHEKDDSSRPKNFTRLLAKVSAWRKRQQAPPTDTPQIRRRRIDGTVQHRDEAHLDAKTESAHALERMEAWVAEKRRQQQQEQTP